MRNCLCCECPIGGQKPLIDQTAFDQTRAFLNSCFVLVTQVFDEAIVHSELWCCYEEIMSTNIVQNQMNVSAYATQK